MHMQRCDTQHIYNETPLHPDNFCFTTHYFRETHCLMYENSNLFVQIPVTNIFENWHVLSHNTLLNIVS